MYTERESEYERWRKYGRDRGWFEKASDEVRSWFGDEDAERRRLMDQRNRDRDFEGERHSPERSRWDMSEQQNVRRDFGSQSRETYSNPPMWQHDRVWQERSNQYVPQTLQSRYAGHYGRGPKSYQRSDDRIRDEICERLYRSSLIDASDVEVEVNQCEVTLTGTVANRDEKRHAEDVAEDVFGVTDVHNNIHISKLGPIGTQLEERIMPPGAGLR